jgi:predicted GIY-YIG superfamily endonuclease
LQIQHAIKESAKVRFEGPAVAPILHSSLASDGESPLVALQTYVGSTADFHKRLSEHNAGQSPHTAKFQPWKPVVVLRFEDDAKAETFERYLKSGSGHAFAKRHLW